MGAAADCELIGAGFFGQPVNSVTTIAFVVAGIIVASRPSTRWPGAALIATGLGSLVFHGPMPPWAEWAHDVSLAWLILVVVGRARRWEAWSRLPGLVALGALFAVFPTFADPVAIGLTIVGLLVLIREDRSASTLAPLGLLALAALVGRLGSTGGPLCDPGSIWQTHGVWHFGAAIAVAWLLLGGPRSDTVIG